MKEEWFETKQEYIDLIIDGTKYNKKKVTRNFRKLLQQGNIKILINKKGIKNLDIGEKK